MRALCSRLAIDDVTCKGDTLVMRFSIAADIDLVRVLMAVRKHPELSVQGGNPPNMFYTLRRKSPEELLQNAVKVMKNVIADYEALAAEAAADSSEDKHEA